MEFGSYKHCTDQKSLRIKLTRCETYTYHMYFLKPYKVKYYKKIMCFHIRMVK